MSYITPAQLVNERAITAPVLMDTALKLDYTAGSGGYGTGATYPQGASFACSFQPVTKRDVLPGNDTVAIDADLYFAITTTLNDHDRVTITHLYGEVQAAPLTYEVIGGPLSDGIVQHAMLRLSMR